ncbi:MAG: hypothetical protein K8T20_11710, partial [Planctomycetes bacterium]|nr:hypothetical protein [Planctomycetota bacterium]
AREGLASGEEKLATAAFIAFCNSKKAPPPEVLRKARPKIWDQMAGEVEGMLAQGGDEEIVTELLKRAVDEADPNERKLLYERAVRSTVPSSAAKFAGALKAETEPYMREPLLVALGNSDSPVAREAIASCLSSRDSAEAAVKALASLIRRGKAERTPTIELILAEKAEDQLQTFCEELLGPTPVPREKLDLEACLVAVLEKNAHNEQSREAITGVLYRFSDMEFGSSRAAVRKWRAWLDEEYRKIRPQ